MIQKLEIAAVVIIITVTLILLALGFAAGLAGAILSSEEEDLNNLVSLSSFGVIF